MRDLGSCIIVVRARRTCISSTWQEIDKSWSCKIYKTVRAISNIEVIPFNIIESHTCWEQQQIKKEMVRIRRAEINMKREDKKTHTRKAVTTGKSFIKRLRNHVDVSTLQLKLIFLKCSYKSGKLSATILSNTSASTWYPDIAAKKKY